MQLVRAVRRQAFRSVNAVVQPIVRRGVGSPPILGAGVVLLQTEGRHSGRPRTRPLLTLRRGDDLVVATVRPRSDWVANLAATDRPTVWVGGTPRTATAQVGPLGTGSVARLSLRADGDTGG
jgi:deazaflavin-dependent oxidoreductase (nitroreductase family)